jgi:hypothetical protein
MNHQHTTTASNSIYGGGVGRKAAYSGSLPPLNYGTQAQLVAVPYPLGPSNENASTSLNSSAPKRVVTFPQ